MRILRPRLPCLALALVIAIASAGSAASAQEASLAHQGQAWLGYMTQVRLRDSFGLWNDAHFVPNGFYVLRTGLTLIPHSQMAVTAGYAYVGLPIGSPPRLRRPEHRPWAQFVQSTPLGERWRVQHRVRYDMRFQRHMLGDRLVSGYSPTHRFRFSLNFRRDLPGLRFGEVLPYFSFGNELLMNAESDRAFDQNRVMAAFGLTRRGLSLQLGYMNRTVQTVSGRFVMNHTFTVWVFHSIDARRPSKRAPPEVQERRAPFGGA